MMLHTQASCSLHLSFTCVDLDVRQDISCLKNINASGPGQRPGRGSGGQCLPEAEAF